MQASTTKKMALFISPKLLLVHDLTRSKTFGNILKLLEIG